MQRMGSCGRSICRRVLTDCLAALLSSVPFACDTGFFSPVVADERWRVPCNHGPDVPRVVTSIVPQSAIDPFEALGPIGWPQSFGYGVASPILHDLDRDGRSEVLLPDDGAMRVYDIFGGFFPGWPRLVTGFSMMNSAVADLDGDGADEVIVGFSWDAPKVYVADLYGNLRPGWPAYLPFSVLTNLSCPVVADLDRDGSLDIGAATEMGVSFFRADGTPLAGWPYLWPVPINNPQWSAPAVGDIDGDGFPEVVVGNVSYPDWGAHVIRHDGTPMPGWPKVTDPIWSSPALADLDGDGKLEIIVQEGDVGSIGTMLWVWRYDGSNFPGWPRTVATPGNSSRSSPAVADLNNDGTLEIVTATSDGMLHVFKSDGSYLHNFPIDTGGLSVIASPSVIDVDGDGLEEIFLTYYSAAVPYTQSVDGWRLDGTHVPGFPMKIHEFTDSASAASVHLADADGDGRMDLATAGVSTAYGGNLWVMEVPGSIASSATRADWPRFRHDALNTGCYGPESAPQGDRPPIADPGDARTAECDRPGAGPIHLDGSRSSDPDSSPGTNDDIVRFEWFLDFGGSNEILLGTGETLDVALSLGPHRVTLRVTDSMGRSAIAEVMMTVVDTVPPTLNVTLSPDTLFPPNHHLIPIHAEVVVGDRCSTPSVALVSAASSEADDAPGGGDGNTRQDIQDAQIGAADFSVLLRAERAGTGTGRVYTLTYSASDEAGNVSSASGFALAPHDRAGMIDPIAVRLEQAPAGTRILWGAVPGMASYNVLRGDLASLQDAGPVINLGPVVCIEENSRDASTADDEDRELPEAGRGFFYLVEYDDGVSRSYGSESAGKPRGPGAGSCP